jgi:hypothetical protein
MDTDGFISIVEQATGAFAREVEIRTKVFPASSGWVSSQ